LQCAAHRPEIPCSSALPFRSRESQAARRGNQFLRLILGYIGIAPHGSHRSSIVPSRTSARVMAMRINGHVLTKSEFGLQPIPASPVLVETALSFRHNAFEAQLGGFLENDGTLGGKLLR
jgi:hypothetical protein